MQFSNEQAISRRPLAYLALVALFHALVLYLLLSQGILQRRSQPAGQVVYMDIRNIAVPRPLPAKPAMTAPTGRPPVKRIAQATPANSPAASATAESPAEPAASSEQTSAITPPVAAGLDLDSLRALARANERKRELTPIEQLRASQERNNSTEARIAAAAKNAQRKDCLTAYTGAGLFAPLLILKDTVTDKGCKW